MVVRSSALVLLVAGFCWAGADTPVTARLKADLREIHPFVPPAAGDEKSAGSGEPLLVLERMVVTGSPAFAVDIQAEARRAAAAREARKFSPLKGGLIFSSERMELGLWPQLVPIDMTPVKKGTVGISVDLLRIKW